MKKIFFIVSFATVAFTNFNINAQQWLWGNGTINTSNAEGWACASDADANVYVAGYFSCPVIHFDADSLINYGYVTVYIAKYDSNGNFLWARGSVSSDLDRALGVTVDNIGQPIITGTFLSSEIIFGTDTLSNGNTTADLFVVKYDANGNVLWARSADGEVNDFYNVSVSSDNENNILVAGGFSTPQLIFLNYSLTNSGNGDDPFIAKYSPSGNLIWAKSIVGNSADECYSVTTDIQSNIIVTGYFISDILILGNDTLHKTLPSGGGNLDFYIAKFDSAGNELWADAEGGSTNDIGYSVTTDIVGNVYVTGSFMSPQIIFHNADTLNLQGVGSFFVARYNANGNFAWVKCAKGPAQKKGLSIATDIEGNINVTGTFWGDSVTLGTNTVHDYAGNNYPIFIFTLDEAGNVECGTMLSDGGDDAIAITNDNFGNVYIAGDYIVTDFIIGNDTLHNSLTNAENVFVAKYRPCSSPVNCNSPELHVSVSATICEGETYQLPNGTLTSVSGVYHDTLNSFLNCDSTITTTLAVTSVNAGVTQSGNTLTAIPAGAIYQWIDCSNNFTAIVGATNEIFTALANGSYAVVVSLSGCIDTSLCKELTGIGIFETDFSNSISVFPNPANFELTIGNLQLAFADEIKITDVVGRKISECEFIISGSTVTVDIKNLCAGVYFLSIKKPNSEICFRKFVKE